MATKNKAPAKSKKTAGRPRGTWLQALSRPDDPGHRAPTLVLYRLLKLSNLISQPFFSDDAARYQISMNELRVLTTLAPLGEAASHEIGVVAGMHPMNVSRAVASLTRHKRVQQRPDPENRRRKLLTLTSKGWKLHAELMPHVEDVAGKVFATLDPKEIEVLSGLLDKMTTQLDGHVPPPAPDRGEIG